VAFRVSSAASLRHEWLTNDALVLFAKRLSERLAVRVEELLAPCAQVLAKVLECGTSPEPIPVIDLVNDETGLEHDHVRDHWIVDLVGVSNVPRLRCNIRLSG